MDKVVDGDVDTVSDIESGARLSVGDFGCRGIPAVLIDALLKSGVTDRDAVSNSCGANDWGAGPPARRQATAPDDPPYVGENRQLRRQYLSADLAGELTPHGNFVHRDSACSFNPLTTICGRVTIAEVEELVEPAELNPNDVRPPGSTSIGWWCRRRSRPPTSNSRSAP